MNSVILLAGSSERSINGSAPDAFVNAANRPLISYALKAYQANQDIDEIGVVCAAGYERRLRAMAYNFGMTKLKWIVTESEMRSDESIAVSEAAERYNSDDIVLIHDCNRPNISQEIISASVESAREYGSGIVSLECDSQCFLYNSAPINGLRPVFLQYPQSYSAEVLKRNCEKASLDLIDESSIYNMLVEAGEDLHFVEGSGLNFSITNKTQLGLFEKLYTDSERAIIEVVDQEKVDLNKKKQEENDGTMVTVVCTTYNHEKYIAQALDSFLMQKTNFKFKVFVGEDCGPDHTKDIVLDYAKRYPDIIVPFIREKNLGATRNTIDMTSQATSPYICFCEGDDYWIDEYKLQKQFDYMEEHKDYVFCFARTEAGGYLGDFGTYYKPEKNGKYIYPDCEPGYVLKKTPYTAEDFIKTFPEHTSTYFFRWDYNLEFPEWFFDGVMGDIPLRLLQMRDKKAGYIPDVVSVYRRNETGAFSQYRDKDKMFVATRGEYIRWLFGMLDFYVKNKIKQYPKALIEERLKIEFNNMITSALMKLDEYDIVLETFEKYPDAAAFILKYYLSADNDRRVLESRLGWNGYQAVVRNRFFRTLMKPYAKICSKILANRAKKQKGKKK